MKHLDVTNPATLETALEDAPIGTRARVVTAGETFHLTRMPGGWYAEGDVVVASGDVVDGQPSEVSLYTKEDDQ